MKKIYRFILLLAAVFAFAPVASAEGDEDDKSKDIVLSKSISPVDHETGIYKLTLDSYLKGSAEAKPADIVLVLDVSGSMNDNMAGGGNSGERISALKEAVNAFILTIDKHDYYVDWNKDHPTTPRGQRLGDRISIIKFAGNGWGKGGSEKDLHEAQYSQPNQNYYAYDDIYINSTLHQNQNATQLVKNLTLLDGTNQQLTQAVSRLNPNGSTAADYGLLKASHVLNAEDNGSKTPFNDNKVVIFFTDGDPTYGTGFDRGVAGNAINAAKKLKDAGAIVYSVGVFSGTPSNEVNTYMNSVSSKYPKASANVISYNKYSSSWGQIYISEAGRATYDAHNEGPSNDSFYMVATNRDALKQIFIRIADSIAARDDLTSGTTVQDFVTSSFKLPANANTINVYTYNYIGENSWSREGLWASSSRESDADKIKITTVNGETKVTVSGFDYSANWCGIHADGTYGGKKLSIEIPIEIKDNIVGGHGIYTNSDESGLILPGETTPVVTFEKQHVDIPINLWIKKYGLLKGESAKFTVSRKPISGGNWEKFTDVVITGTGNIVTASENKDADVEDEAPYYDMYTSPMAKLEGLSDQYYYKVEEESWSWSYKSEAKTAISTDPSTEGGYLEFNPFIFVNTKQNTSRKHAESIVTNDFGAGTYITVDSREFFQK